MANQYNNTPLLGHIVVSTNKETSVWWIQQKLNRIYPDQHIAEDNQLGYETLNLIKRFQRENGLSPDGDVGPLTLKALMNADPWKDAKVSVPPESMGERLRTQLLNWGNKYPEKLKNDFIKVISSILDTISNINIGNCLSENNWQKLADICNAELKKRDNNLINLQKELEQNEKEYYRRNETQKRFYNNRSNMTEDVFYMEKNDNGSKMIEAKRRIEQKNKTINAKLLSPEDLKVKISNLSKVGGKVAGIGFACIEPAFCAWDLYKHYTIPIEDRRADWENIANHLWGKFWDAVGNVILGYVIGSALTAAGVMIGLSGGPLVAAVVLAGILITFITEFLLGIWDAIFYGETDLTGLERCQISRQQIARIYVGWADNQTLTNNI